MSLATEYDKWHEKVFESDPEHADESSPWYKIVLEYLPPIQGKRVLEIACGRGGFARLLASKGASVTGADFSASAVDIAKEKLSGFPKLADRVAYVQADAQHMPFDACSFDIVISCETIEHVPDARAAVCEMHRVCRPGGTLYLTTPNYLNFMGLYLVYAAVRHPRLKSSQPLDNRFLFPGDPAICDGCRMENCPQRRDGPPISVHPRSRSGPILQPRRESHDAAFPEPFRAALLCDRAKGARLADMDAGLLSKLISSLNELLMRFGGTQFTNLLRNGR